MSDTGPDVSGMRISYEQAQLIESDIAATPLLQFNNWMAQSVAVGSDVITEPNAMVLATADSHGVVTTRSVLLKGIDSRGLSFYTNYGSRKAAAMADNSHVSVTFPWYQLQRQINVVGTVTKLSREESTEYFYQRPHLSQLGAIVSAQSTEIASRDVLEDAMKELQEKYPAGTKIPMPDNWGGYLISVDSIEFWQGRRSRLHDRLRFVQTGTSHDLSDASSWKVIRVSP